MEALLKNSQVQNMNVVGTPSFYKCLFFKQLQGFQQQALADAVVAYALNIDNLGALEGAVKQVTEKHN